MKRVTKGLAVPDPATKGVKAPGAPGLDPHVPTKKSRKKVRLLASLGFTQEEIGIMMDCGKSTLQRHYQADLRAGGLEADAAVLENLFKIATGKGTDASRAAMFWAKVRRRWHEVQRVIHGYDPETIKSFVKSVTIMLRRELPACCPGCKTKLDLGPKVASELIKLSEQMAAKLPESQIVPMPRPELAGDHLED